MQLNVVFKTGKRKVIHFNKNHYFLKNVKRDKKQKSVMGKKENNIEYRVQSGNKWKPQK